MADASTEENHQMDSELQTNLIINYLPQSFTDEQFYQLFASVGPLKNSKIVRDRNTNYSYGFGFIDYEKPEDAAKAIAQLNGLQLQHKTIKVAYSRKGENIKGSNLYIKNLPRTMSKDDLESLFSPYGTVVSCRVIMDQALGTSKGVGFVLFSQRNEAEAAQGALQGFVAPNATTGIQIAPAEQNETRRQPHGDGFFQPRAMSGRGGVGGGIRSGGPMRGRGGMNRGNNRFNPMGGAVPQGGPPTQPGGVRGPPPPRPGFGMGFYNPMAPPAGYGQDFSQDSMGGNFGNPPPPPSAKPPTQQMNPVNKSDGSGPYILFVYNIGTDATENSLWQLFAPFGAIEKVNCMYDFEKNCCKGYGFVSMRNYEEACAAIQSLHGYVLKTKPLQVSFKSPKSG